MRNKTIPRESVAGLHHSVLKPKLEEPEKTSKGNEVRPRKRCVLVGCALVFVTWAYALPGVGSPTALTDIPGETDSASGIQNKTKFDSGWVAIAAPSETPKRVYQGCCWDPVHDQIYSYGGEWPPYLGGHATVDRYDPATNTWTPVAQMSPSASEFKGLYCNGHIYVIAGYPFVNTVQEYSIATNTWQLKAPIPDNVADYEAIVYRDSLLYVFGGTPDGTDVSIEVQIFNPATNTWAYGTDMPTGVYRSDACIIGDTVYVPGGQTGTEAVSDKMFWGAINPANPTQITWGQEPGTIAGGVRCQGPCVALNGKVYYFGGFRTYYSGYPTDSGYVFDPATRTYAALLTYPRTVAMCCLATVRENAEIYGLAGWLNDTALPGYYRLRVATFHDAGVTQIVVPKVKVRQGNSFYPSAWVRNFGPQAEKFRVRMQIDPGYTDPESVYVQPEESTLVDFSLWTAADSGEHTARCSTMLADDGNHVNDTCIKVFTVTVVAVEQPSTANAPKAFALDVPSPNPSRDAVTIRYALPQAADISLKLYDAAGKLRAVLDQGRKAAGEYSVTFDLRDSRFDIAPGLYFVRLESPSFVRTRKVVITQ